MAHPIHRFSAIARPVEPQYPTNLAILIVMGLTLVALGVTAIVRGADPTDALLAGMMGALVVFVTWALARDLAPDDNPAAFIALVPVAAVVLYGATPAVLGPLVAMGLVRVVNRSVGPPAKRVDRVVLTVMVFVVAPEDHGIGVGVAAVLAFTLDALLPERSGEGWPFAGLAAAATVMGVLIGDVELHLVTPGPWTWGAIAVAVAFGLVMLTQPPPGSASDVDPEVRLRRDRVQGGMLVGLVAAMGSLPGGDPAVLTWGVAWAACLGVVIGRPLLRLRPPLRLRSQPQPDRSAVDQSPG
ncbi:MAG: hypothetical protein AAGF11_01500 [Myxococcota bacterium]